MYPTFLALALAILFLDTVRAGLFVVEPLQGSTCNANKPCTITWVDNGERPLLTAIGMSTIGLYTGRQQLVQTLPPVDVSKTQSVTFTPNPAAGPNSDTYYISITSTTLKGNDSLPYSGWSSFFTLKGMGGSFQAPLASATAPIAVPSSLTVSTSGSVATSTRTIGVLSTKASSKPSERSSTSSSRSTSSRLSTVITSPTASSSTSSSSSSTPVAASGSITPSGAASTPTTTAATTTPTALASTSAASAANAVATSSATDARRLSVSVLVLSIASSLLYSALG